MYVQYIASSSRQTCFSSSTYNESRLIVMNLRHGLYESVSVSVSVYVLSAKWNDKHIRVWTVMVVSVLYVWTLHNFLYSKFYPLDHGLVSISFKLYIHTYVHIVGLHCSLHSCWEWPPESNWAAPGPRGQYRDQGRGTKWIQKPDRKGPNLPWFHPFVFP